jgi:hypothetical protein
MPSQASGIAPEVKITFVINVFTAAQSIFNSKSGTGNTTGTTTV